MGETKPEESIKSESFSHPGLDARAGAYVRPMTASHIVQDYNILNNGSTRFLIVEGIISIQYGVHLAHFGVSNGQCLGMKFEEWTIFGANVPEYWKILGTNI